MRGPQMEKNQSEILLEDIQGKFELVLEGHESLRKEIREAWDESNQKHEQTAFLINTLNKEIDAVATELADHRADTEGHKKTYWVGDREH